MNNKLIINFLGDVRGMIILIGIFSLIITSILFFKSKLYRMNRIVSAVFYEEEYDSDSEYFELAVKKNLIKVDKNNNVILTEKGFDFMNASCSNFIAYLALIVSLLSGFVALSNNFCAIYKK